MSVRDPDLFGLILTGGKSTRMGKDKAAMVYGNKPQYQHAFALLESVCAKVFLSTRKDQAAGFDDLPQIHDASQYEGKGPLAGILSAMHEHPQAAWLVLACDLPFVTEKTLDHLLAHRNAKAFATAYRSQFDGLPEPLCAIWEKGNLTKIDELFQKGVHCPRKVLIQNNTRLIDVQVPGELDNVNDPAEAAQALSKFKVRK